MAQVYPTSLERSTICGEDLFSISAMADSDPGRHREMTHLLQYVADGKYCRPNKK